MKCFVNKSGTIGYYICFTPFPLHSNSQNTNQINSLINQIEFTFSLTSHIIILFSVSVFAQLSTRSFLRVFASAYQVALCRSLHHRLDPQKKTTNTHKSINQPYIPAAPSGIINNCLKFAVRANVFFLLPGRRGIKKILYHRRNGLE